MDPLLKSLSLDTQTPPPPSQELNIIVEIDNISSFAKTSADITLQIMQQCLKEDQKLKKCADATDNDIATLLSSLTKYLLLKYIGFGTLHK